MKNYKHINLNEENSYSISSVSSEIKYVNNNEIVYMTKVEAIFIGKDKQAVKIISDFAVYNKLDNQTFFEKNFLFMKYMHELSQFAITQKIPIVITNMIRTIDGKEIENMKSAIDPFTHIKIHLLKNFSRFEGQIYWALDQEFFSYTIDAIGLTDYAEDF